MDISVWRDLYSWKTPCRTVLMIYWKSEELADERSLVVTWGKGIFLLGMAGFSDTTLPSKNIHWYHLMRWDIFNLSSGILPMLMLGGAATGPGGLRAFYKKSGNTPKSARCAMWLAFGQNKAAFPIEETSVYTGL